MVKTSFFSILLAISLFTGTICGQTTNGAIQFTIGTAAPLNAALPGGSDMPANNLFLGSSGFGRLGSRFIVGGSGFGAAKRSMSTSFGEISTDFGMGFADFGYAFFEKGRHLHYIFAGIGGGGIEARYRNTGEKPVSLAENYTLGPGARAKLSSGGFAWQAGISINGLLFNPTQNGGGAKVGFDIGVFHFPFMSRWYDDVAETHLSGIGRPRLQGVFARLTIGGAW